MNVRPLLLMVMCAVAALGDESYRGWCEQGGHTVTTAGMASVTKTQASYPLCTLTVYPHGSTTPVASNQVFSDNSGTVLGNPFTADSNGYFTFFVANGHYDIKRSGTIPTWTEFDVLFADPAGSSPSVTSVSAGAGVSVTGPVTTPTVTNTGVTSAIAGAGASVSGATGAVTFGNLWGAVPTGSQTQYLRLQPNAGNSTTFQFASLPALYAADYNFPSQSPGGAIVGGVAISITMTPVPLGVNGTDTDHALEVSGGVGSAEPCLITGGAGTSGQSSGVIILLCAGSHSGAFTVASANGGTSEAAWMLPASGGRIVEPSGTIQFHYPVRRRINMPILVQGQGEQATTVAVASDFPLTVNGVFDWSPGDNPAVPIGGVSDLTVSFTQPDSTNVATYTHWPPAGYTSGTYHTEWRNIAILAAWDGFTMSGNNNGAQFYNITGSYFHRGFNLEPTGHSFDTVRINNFQAVTTGLTSNQGTAFTAATTANVGIYAGSIDDLKIDGGTIISALVADFHQGSDTLAPGVEMTGMWAEGNIILSDGSLKIENLHFSGGAAGNNAVTLTRGTLQIANSSIDYAGTTTAILVLPGSVSTSAPYSIFSMSNTTVNTLSSDVRSVQCQATGSYTGVFPCILTSGNTFNRTAGVAYTAPTVVTVAGTGDVRLTAIGNTFSDKGAGSGNAIVLDTDTFHVVTGNQGGGYAYSVAARASTQWFGNSNFAGPLSNLTSPLKVTGKVSASSLVVLAGTNYIASETGINNAIAGALTDAANTAVPVADGLCVTQQLAHTLQAGANTYALNGGSAVAIKSSRNPANNIAVAYAATGRWTGCYNSTGPVWMDVAQ